MIYFVKYFAELSNNIICTVIIGSGETNLVKDIKQYKYIFVNNI